VEKEIINTPLTYRYDGIKAELNRRLSHYEQQRVDQLLTDEDMADSSRAQFIRHLRTITAPSVPSDFLSNLWTNRLPQNINSITATQAQGALDDVTQLADKLGKVTPPPCFRRCIFAW
jgi:hypothetical protein